ncbi:MAG: ATP-binding protein [Clostridia bacterium]
MINRPEYLKGLINWKDKDLIKVVSGIRGCGKSTLFNMYMQHLKDDGIDDEHIILINLELFEYSYKDYMELYMFVKDKIVDDKIYYIFLDEVQNIEMFQKAVVGLYTLKNVDLYISGSNSYLLDGKLATFLSGRYIEIKMLPLSFKEYKSYFNLFSNEELYLKYINSSSFPYAFKLDNEREIDNYIEGLFNTIIVKDVAFMKRMLDIELFIKVIKFLYSSNGSILTIKKITDTLIFKGKTLSFHTVENYINLLTDSYIINKVERYDIKDKRNFLFGNKYYSTDVTLIYTLLGRNNVDIEYILENVVYLELIRRGFRVYVGKVDDLEVDFVAENFDGLKYYQVALTVRDEKVLERELKPLQSTNDHYPKCLLTMDRDLETDYDGILKMNVIDWLLK